MRDWECPSKALALSKTSERKRDRLCAGLRICRTAKPSDLFSDFLGKIYGATRLSLAAPDPFGIVDIWCGRRATPTVLSQVGKLSMRSRRLLGRKRVNCHRTFSSSLSAGRLRNQEPRLRILPLGVDALRQIPPPQLKPRSDQSSGLARHFRRTGYPGQIGESSVIWN